MTDLFTGAYAMLPMVIKGQNALVFSDRNGK